MKNKKDIIYIFFTIIFYISSIAIVCWIDRQEINKKVDERAKEICQKDFSTNSDKVLRKDFPFANSASNDADAPITSKEEASESLKNIDALVNSAQEINLSN